ncbi:hypothetical protein VPH35_050719 [Triticum aestivum]
MASGTPWKPLFWDHVRRSYTMAGGARAILVDAARHLALPLRHGVEEEAISAMDACESKLGEVCGLLGFLLSALGTVELLSLRCMRCDDSEEQQLRARARAARSMAGAAYDGIAKSRGHLGAAARIFARADLPRSCVDLEVRAAARAIAEALEQVHGMEASLGTRGDLASPSISMAHGVDSNTIPGPAAAAAHPGSKRGRGNDDAWRSLARSVPGALLQARAALPELEAARAELSRCAYAFKSSEPFDQAATAAAYTDALLTLEAAHAAISRVLCINGGASAAFLAATGELGLDRVGPRWVSWEESRSDVGRHGRAALDLLWSASACVDCHFGCIVLGSASPSPEMLRRAVSEAGEARDAAKIMAGAAIRMSVNAWAIINGV